MSAKSVTLIAALVTFLGASAAGAAATRCPTPPGNGIPQDMYALHTSCATSRKVQRRYVRVVGDCGNYVCAFVAAGRDWVCHDRVHADYDQIRCVADTNHALRVGWRDSEY